MSVPRLLPRAQPDEVGVDPGGIVAFLDAVDADGIEMHSLQVVRHGRVCAEATWAPYRAADAPLLYSLSKTFTSAAVGIAVAEGALSYEDRLVDLFADVATGVGPKASRIRVRDCLSMTMGYTRDIVPTDGLSRLPRREPWRALLAEEPDGEPGVTFQYNQAAPWTLAEMVAHATGHTVADLLRLRVFEPRGIEDAAWDTDEQGRLLGYTGLHLHPEGIAAFFQLLLDDGVHAGVRLLPETWVRQYRQRHADTGSWEDPDWAQGYGWQVWANTRGGARGDGAYGQFAILIPARDALVVMTARTPCTQALLDHVWAHLLPAMGRPGEPAPGLEGRLRSAALPTVRGERGGAVHLSFENRSNRWHLDDAPDGWLLRWVDADGGDHVIPVGYGRWITSTMSWGERRLRVAACGAWVAWGHWVGHVVTLDSPHGLLVRLRDDGSGRIDWMDTPPLFRRSLASLSLR